MRGHAEMDRQLDAAEREGRCLHPTSESVRKALLRRVKTGDIVSPRPGLFIRSALWRSLDAIDQVNNPGLGDTMSPVLTLLNSDWRWLFWRWFCGRLPC